MPLLKSGKRASNGRPLATYPIIKETTMIIANRTLNVIDVAFTVIDRIERVDYIAIGRAVIDKAIITAAVIIGVATYVITALQLLWLEHNETIITNAVRFTFIIADTIGATYYAGHKLRPLVNHWTARLTDTLFYAFAA